MNQYISNNLQPGDKIVSDYGLYRHYAIGLGIDNLGRKWISENKKGHGVGAILAEVYFANLPANSWIEKFQGTPIKRKRVVDRALLQTGKQYDIISYNCEHHVNEAQYGVAQSSQVKNVLVLAAVIGLGVALFKS